MKLRYLLIAVAALAVWSLRAMGPVVVHAEEAWKAEFEAVCANSNDSMELSVEKLKELVARCDKLKPVIEGLEPSPRKVFLKRLKLCRDLYAFVLEGKLATKSPEKEPGK